MPSALSTSLGLKTVISFDGKGGTLSIHYRTLEQLDDVLGRLNQDPLAANQGVPADKAGLAPAEGSADGPSDELSDEIMERIVEGLAEGLAAKAAKPAGPQDQAADRDEGKGESERQTRPGDRPQGRVVLDLKRARGAGVDNPVVGSRVG